MKFLGNLHDPYVNNTNHFILISDIQSVPEFNDDPATGFNTAGNLYTPTGELVGQYTISNWGTDSTTNATFSGFTRKHHIVVPPNYSFKYFTTCIAWEIEDMDELKWFL